MELARVLGSVTATDKVPGLSGVKLLLVEPLDERLSVVGDPFVVCDATQAGPGEVVAWIGGREAVLALPQHFVPVDGTIVGIVSNVAVGGQP